MGATTWPCYSQMHVIMWCVIKGLHCIIKCLRVFCLPDCSSVQYNQKNYLSIFLILRLYNQNSLKGYFIYVIVHSSNIIFFLPFPYFWYIVEILSRDSLDMWLFIPPIYLIKVLCFHIYVTETVIKILSQDILYTWLFIRPMYMVNVQKFWTLPVIAWQKSTGRQCSLHSLRFWLTFCASKTWKPTF